MIIKIYIVGVTWTYIAINIAYNDGETKARF